MNCLDDDKLTEVIDEHIIKNDALALCIDGSWGIGKSYFIRNYIEKKVGNNKREVKEETKRIYFGKRKKVEENEKKEAPQCIYVSLYGVSTKEEIRNKIIEYRIKNYVKNGKIISFFYKNINFVDKCLKASIKNDKVKEIFNNVDLVNILNNISCVEGDVIFFDEIERCQMDILDVLGIIYDYIDTEKAKCILIMNESELFKDKNKNIKDEYLRKKEKVVELTVKYHNDLKAVMNDLIKNENDDLKELIYYNINDIIILMEYYKHTNIRTLKYAIYVAKKILESILKKDDLKLKKLKENIVFYIFISSMAYKMGKSVTDFLSDEIIKLKNMEMHIFRNGYECIEVYIQTGFLDKNKLNLLIDKYLLDKDDVVLDKNNIIDIIVHYWQNDEKEVEIALEKFLKLLKDNKFEVEKYPSMIASLTTIESIGFEKKDVIEKIYERMKENLKNCKEKEINFRDTFLFDIEDFSSKAYKEKILEFEKIYVKTKNEGFIKSINDALDEDMWGEKIFKLRASYLVNNKLNTGYLNLFDINKLKVALKNGRVKDISDFRRDLYSYYESTIKEILSLDLDSFKELDKYIVNELLADNVPSIRKFNYKRIHEFIEKIIRRIEKSDDEIEADV